MRKEWEGFVAGNWTEHIDVEEFIKLNYHPYDGDGSFGTDRENQGMQ